MLAASACTSLLHLHLPLDKAVIPLLFSQLWLDVLCWCSIHALNQAVVGRLPLCLLACTSSVTTACPGHLLTLAGKLMACTMAGHSYCK